MRCIILAAILLLPMGAGAFAQDTSPSTPPASQTAPAPSPDAASTPPPDATLAPPSDATPANPAPTGPRVLIQTSMGDITLQLDPVHAPRTMANFLRYVKERHYDGTVFYRVAAGFVIQMGSWDAKMKGRMVHAGIPLEADNGLSNLRGTVAMAHGDNPASATADFFINLADNTGLDHAKDDTENKTGFAVFGAVVAGMDVVDRIAAVPVGDHGPMPGFAPIDPITVKKVSLLKN